ncbi:MAG: gamma-glutamyltransferase [Sorangiineae bacterium]|nr:gamma-glutamyltransferase [Sorangiineae bacterium]MEB2343330.1 gamma-glutamyltransferase [Deltaproteobacteria bacterium]
MRRSSMLLAGLALSAALGACTPPSAPEPSPPPSASARAASVTSARAAPRASAPSQPQAPARDAGADAAEGVRALVLPGGGPRAAHGKRGVIASVEPHATRAGLSILERGGNAVDAAVAVAYALAVVHPSAGNLGGGGFMLVRMKGQPAVAVDFRETAPRALTRPVFDAMIANHAVGAAAVGVPGSVAGLELARERFGRLPRGEVLAPAIALARDGFPLGARAALTIRWAWPVLARDPAAAAIFGAAGKPRARGDRLRNPDLARTLERVARAGRDGFYKGVTAKRLVDALRGHLSLNDLLDYEAVLREPLRVRYRGLDVLTMPPPSAGGVAIAELLGLLDAHRAWEEEAGSARELHLFLEASRRAQADRRFTVVDPDALPPAALAAQLARVTDSAWLAARAPRIDPERATPSAEVDARYHAVLASLESEHTTHFSVIDADGSVVSCTTTLSAGFGARMVAAGTGVVLNDSVASFGTIGENLPVAGRRTVSSMAPTLVLDHGEVILVLGSPGGDTIPSTVVQVLRNIVDHGMTLDAAIDAPRVHQDFAPDAFRYERARPISVAVRRELEAMGHRVSKKTLPMGDANDLLIVGDEAYGYADPREGGLALAVK